MPEHPLRGTSASPIRVAHLLLDEREPPARLTLCGMSLTWNPDLRVVTREQFRTLPENDRRCKRCERSYISRIVKTLRKAVHHYGPALRELADR